MIEVEFSQPGFKKTFYVRVRYPNLDPDYETPHPVSVKTEGHLVHPGVVWASEFVDLSAFYSGIKSGHGKIVKVYPPKDHPVFAPGKTVPHCSVRGTLCKVVGMSKVIAEGQDGRNIEFDLCKVSVSDPQNLKFHLDN